MFKEFKNTLLKQTTNKVLKQFEGETGTLKILYEDEENMIFTFFINKQKIETIVVFLLEIFLKLFLVKPILKEQMETLICSERKKVNENIC